MQIKRAGKLTYIIFIITAIVIISGYIFYRIKKDDFLDYKLQNLIKEKTNRLYHINYDSIWVNEAEGNLYIKNLTIKGDTLLQLQMLRNSDTNAAKLLLDIFVPQLKVESFKTCPCFAIEENRMQADNNR
jgi:hypothetical protein